MSPGKGAILLPLVAASALAAPCPPATETQAAISPTEMGAGKIFPFCSDSFGDWTFEIG